MALSGSVSVQGTPNVNLVFAWTATQNAEDNQSTVNWELQLVSNDIGYIVATPGSAYFVTVDGKEFIGTTDISIETNSTKTLVSDSVILTHEEDGTRKFDFSFSQDFYITVGENYIGVVSGSGSGELDTIKEETEEPDPDEPDIPDEPEEPVDSFDIQSWLTGYILGISGKPFPFREAQKWETFFDGEVTTIESTVTAYEGLSTASLGVRLGVLGGTYRVTINNAVYTETTSGTFRFGNKYLLHPKLYEDTGQDFVIWGSDAVLFTRTPGTYTLKIERMVTSDG